MNSTKKEGDRGEVIAIEYLQKKGYKIIETNYVFGRFWEVDIIAKWANRYCFVEVKYRNNWAYGTPEESISPSKLRKIRKTIEFYTMKNHIGFENIQLDVIAILKEETSYKLTHYKNIEI